MEEEQLQPGVKYIIKVGRNNVAVRLVQQNVDGAYLVKNLKTNKPFFVRSAKAFLDFQNEGEKEKAMEIIATENTSTPAKKKNAATKTSKKRSEVMGHSKCAFVKALGKLGFKADQTRKILDHFKVKMPDASLKIQLYFGTREKCWAKFGKPAELTSAEKSEIETILLRHIEDV